MGLLGGIPSRRPVVGLAYAIPRDYYDPNDPKEHRQLVIGLDMVRREAITVSRTSQPHARGPLGVSHPAEPDLGFEVAGWWRLHDPHQVPFTAFEDESEVEVLGRVDERTMQRIQEMLSGSRGGGSDPGAAHERG